MKNKKNAKPSLQSEQVFFGPNVNFAAKEAFKLLRTNLLFSLPEKPEGKGRIIGVTSSVKGEGKSTTVVNLASTLAEQNARVLIVEGDMRIPSMHTKLNVRPKPGLSNMLVSSDPVDKYLQSVEVGTVNGFPITFDVLVAGEVPPNPSELIGSERMKRRFDQLSGMYDFILLDLPPVTAVTDALVATKIVDGIIIVVRNEYANSSSLKEAIRQLRLVDSKILGFVYTHANNPHGGYGYKKQNKHPCYD